jgi:hypothetical protein
MIRFFPGFTPHKYILLIYPKLVNFREDISEKTYTASSCKFVEHEKWAQERHPL